MQQRTSDGLDVLNNVLCSDIDDLGRSQCLQLCDGVLVADLPCQQVCLEKTASADHFAGVESSPSERHAAQHSFVAGAAAYEPLVGALACTAGMH